MKIRTIKYHIQQGIHSLFKNRLMSLASIATVAANAFLLIISLSLVLNLDYMLQQVENTVGIAVFVSDEATDDEIIDIQQGIQAIEHVKNVEYISKDDALEEAKNSWGDENADLLNGLENDNPFPRNFNISLDSVKYQKDVISALQKLQKDTEIEMLKSRELIKIENDATKETADTENSENTSQNETASDPTLKATAVTSAENGKLISQEDIGKNNYSYIGIEKIRHAQKESEMLTTINTALRIISIILIAIMCIIAVAIIMNTIKLTVFIRKNEINIMKYVGATDWFIRWPFIIEGLLIGLIGSIIPCLICMISYSKIIDLINSKLTFLTNTMQFKSSPDLFSLIIPITLILGMSLGALGSITSIRKHLNV